MSRWFQKKTLYASAAPAAALAGGIVFLGRPSVPVLMNAVYQSSREFHGRKYPLE